ncbi:MAG: hypothetical protein QW692_02075 [Nitrososphaerota archaeon]
MMMLRKFVKLQFNGIAYYIYIPRAYARSMALEPGDLMLAELQPDGALLIRPLEITIRETIPVEKKEKTRPPETPPAISGGLKEVTPRYGGEETRI